MDALRLENISFSYNGSEKIFDNVNFTLEYGDFVLLSGVSGEGKSTLLSIINGMIPFITPGKLEGKIYVNSEDVTAVRVSERAKLIGTVLQNADEQIVYDIVRDEIAFGCENLDIPVETIDRRIEASTNMMKISPDAKTRTMSGGQKQRLITASTLAMKQKIIILDEPLANLDVEGAHVLLGALRSLAKSGYAVLLVEHRLDVVRPYVNKVMWIKDKNVTMSADKDAVLRCERVIEPENRPHTVGSPVISGRGLVFSAGGRNILDSLDIDVYKGERLVLLGANGCGKTTLMRTLARLNKLTSGTLEQNIVQKPGRRKPNAAWFKKVGFVYQNPTYQLFMPTLLAEASFRASSEQKAREMIEAFDLSGLENRHPQSLSEGQKRRAGLAAICAGEPEVLFLDEPTVGQDYNNLERIVSAVNKLNRENGCTVVTVTHDRRCAAAMADRVLIMDSGKIAEQGDGSLADGYLNKQFKIIGE